MIIDNINNCENYFKLHPNFKKAFEFLINSKNQKFQESKIVIDSENVFALPSIIQDKMSSSIQMESHNKYIDIHYIIEGTEKLGWKSLNECKGKIGEFDFENDYILYNENNIKFFELKENEFCIFYPEDVHVPLVETNRLKKIVLKIKN